MEPQDCGLSVETLMAEFAGCGPHHDGRRIPLSVEVLWCDRCPRCRRHFRTLEDEEGMHDCPHCGYGPEDDEPEEPEAEDEEE
jgi:hypothetical protein